MKAFSLVECVIMVAAFSLLVSIAIPNLIRVRARVETSTEGHYKGYYSEGRHEPILTRCMKKGGCPND